MEARRKELEKLTVAALRSLITPAPPKNKKKAELVDIVIAEEFAPEHDKTKRMKIIAPVFEMAKGSSSSSNCCDLCEGHGSVWCELGLAVCPICKSHEPQTCILPSPSVKQERGITAVPYMISSDGKIILRIAPGIEPKMLINLVTSYGFGICESIEALSTQTSIEGATEYLKCRTRVSAENSSLAEAQLNSEQTRDMVRESQKKSQKQAREAVEEDLSVLLELDKTFCSVYIFSDQPPDGGRLLAWALDCPQHRLLLFDYLSLKRDSIRWYKNPCSVFFDAMENEFLQSRGQTDIGSWMSEIICSVRNALYSLPDTGGSIPALFRDAIRMTPETSVNDEDLVIMDDKNIKGGTNHNIEFHPASLFNIVHYPTRIFHFEKVMTAFLMKNSSSIRGFSHMPPSEVKFKRLLSDEIFRKQHTHSSQISALRGSRMIIIDWDDTLNPSSWCMRSGVLTIRSPSENELLSARELSLKVAVTLQKCLKHGFVVIVTNAEAGWVELSAKSLMPDVSRVLVDIPVISSRTLFETMVRDSPTLWKALTFGRLITEWFESFPEEILLNDFSLEVLSIGDADHERDALLHVCSQHEVKFISKTIKLLERPTIEDLKRQHDLIHEKLDWIVTFHRPLDVFYQHGKLVDFLSLEKVSQRGFRRPSKRIGRGRTSIVFTGDCA